MPEQAVRVDSQQVRYLEEGEGQPVVLLHGASLGSSGDVFERNLRPLAEGGLRAIAPDRPGYGLSQGPGDRSSAGHRQFVLGLLDALDIESAIVVGHSQQGSVAAQLALEAPDRVPRAIVLGGGGVLPPLPEGGDGPEGEGERLQTEPTLEQTRALLEANLYNHALITPEVLEQRHRLSVGRNFAFYSQPPANRAGGAPSPAEPLWQRVGANPEQFLLIFGRQDKPTTARRCERARELFPRLRLILLDQCGHLVQWDHADEFVRQTIAFAHAPSPAH
jgi:pimeloyl-ACP methyl ester carboxylesterase